MPITAEVVEIFLKTQKGAEIKLLKGLVKRHISECHYAKVRYVNLRDDPDIKMLLKCAKMSRAAFNKE